ncbi:hypothetical protein BDV95DRAFT_625961 [Massariosphaeria phaeospora]|uniref:Uncharacterized protein n=1 Tax=Massariosphaeria phaeospora TaxID=100035 RepID=A0A7C8MCB9_9PLEO|nr:hypothetical protein BDV95DRAFT_625961 [Massariosphaeria phaeospora]
MELFTLNKDEERALEEDNLLQPSLNPNKRKSSTSISNATGTTFLEDVQAYLPSPSSTTSTFEFPQSVESVAALEFIGFTPVAAVKVYSHWHAQSEEDRSNGQNTFDSMYRGAVARLSTTECTNMAPTDAMQLVGLNSKTIEAIADPSFEAVRNTETLHYWVRDTLDINYATLLALKRRLKRLLPDHVFLYKGKAAISMNGRWINDDGSIRMPGLHSDTNGDFNRDNKAWYFSVEQETAEVYRLWAANRCRISETWMIRIQIWYSRDWEEYVWDCRSENGGELHKFDHFRNAEYLVGHVCGTGVNISRIQKSEVQDHISENSLLHISSGKATQSVFMNRNVAERLGALIKGKIHVDVFAPKEVAN